jgi:hypothetical protein
VKLLETAGKTIKTAAAAVVKAIAAPTSHRCGFNCDCERKAEVNGRGVERWLGPRRRGWLR